MANISSRAGEMEADKLGMRMIMAAGLDPREVFLSSWISHWIIIRNHHPIDQALKLWQLVAALHPEKPSFLRNLLRTHPHPHFRLL